MEKKKRSSLKNLAIGAVVVGTMITATASDVQGKVHHRAHKNHNHTVVHLYHDNKLLLRRHSHKHKIIIPRDQRTLSIAKVNKDRSVEEREKKLENDFSYREIAKELREVAMEFARIYDNLKGISKDERAEINRRVTEVKNDKDPDFELIYRSERSPEVIKAALERFMLVDNQNKIFTEDDYCFTKLIAKYLYENDGNLDDPVVKRALEVAFEASLDEQFLFFLVKRYMDNYDILMVAAKHCQSSEIIQYIINWSNMQDPIREILARSEHGSFGLDSESNSLVEVVNINRDIRGDAENALFYLSLPRQERAIPRWTTY